MSTEVITEATTETTPIPPLAPNGAEVDKRKQVRTKPAEDDAATSADDDKIIRGKTQLTPELKKIQAAEDGDLRDVLDSLGTDGSFKISVARLEPEQARDPATGRMVKVDGHLKTYTQRVDQELIAARHGGGRFRLTVHRKAEDGSYKIFTKRVIDVAGDPRTDDVPRNVEPASVTAAAAHASSSSEQPSIVKDVLNVMKDQLDKANARTPGPSGPDPAMAMMLEMFQQQNAALAAELREVRREAAEARNAKPEKTEGDAFKDGLVKQLLDGDSARLTSVRMQYESEIRMIKDQQREAEARIQDRFDRDKVQIEAAHQRELALVRHSNEQTIAAIKQSLDTSKEVLHAQIKGLERENTQLREEVKDLRAKKEKSPLEMAKEFKVYKDTFGGDDDKEEESTIDKVVAAIPQAIEVAQGMINKKNAPAQAQQQQAQQPRPPQIVQDRNGDRFVVRGNELVPVKKKGQKVAVANAEGQPPTEVEIPAIEPEKLANAISFLERAFSGNQEPEVVAQSAKPFLPDEIMVSIRDLGVDVFMTKVAKLPSASPLSSQAGKVWYRKVGKALVGGD